MISCMWDCVLFFGSLEILQSESNLVNVSVECVAVHFFTNEFFKIINFLKKFFDLNLKVYLVNFFCQFLNLRAQFWGIIFYFKNLGLNLIDIPGMRRGLASDYRNIVSKCLNFPLKIWEFSHQPSFHTLKRSLSCEFCKTFLPEIFNKYLNLVHDCINIKSRRYIQVVIIISDVVLRIKLRVIWNKEWLLVIFKHFGGSSFPVEGAHWSVWSWISMPIIIN